MEQKQQQQEQQEVSESQFRKRYASLSASTSEEDLKKLHEEMNDFFEWFLIVLIHYYI
jgi:hypothetical protein